MREKVKYGSQCGEAQEHFYNYELYFYLLCQHFQERDFTSGFYNSFYRRILIYRIYSERVFKTNGKNNTASIIFVFS